MANREIKFRGFNNFAKAMYPAEHFALRSDGIWLQSMGDNEWLPSQGDMTFMQYTGLKDKNGVEIYEGDVVKTTDSKSVWVVSYVAPQFIVTISSGGISAELYADLEHEVIGNIYQNPELLKD